MKTTTRMTSFRLTLGLLACCLTALPAGASDITVDTTEDTLDGWCTTLPWPPDNCSLRKALTLANESPGKDTIHLQPGTYVLTRVGTEDDLNITGDLDVLDDVDIKGAGAGITVIDGNWTDRVFHAPARAPEVTAFQLFDLTVQNGTADIESDGGGIQAIQSNLSLWRCEVRLNRAPNGGGQGIDSRYGTLLIVDSTVAYNGDPNNPLQYPGGGVRLGGGTLLSIRSTFHSNRALSGSAIYCDNAVLNTVNTTFAYNNTAGATRGALHLVECDTVIDSTTFSGNAPHAISGSTATGPGLLTLRNTYVDDGCNFAGGFCPTSEGGNIEGGGMCCFGGPDDVSFAPNQVGPLGDHGGHTWTMLPLPLTTLLDNPRAVANCQPEDQRLVTRPQSGLPGAPIACDTGAVELRQEDLAIIFTDGFETGNTSAWQ